MPYLIVSKSFKEYKVFPVHKGETTIGHNSENHVAFVGPDTNSVSRKHAVISQKKGRYILTDCSRNGTIMKGTPIKEVELSPGDSFQISNFYFTFVAESALDNQDEDEANETVILSSQVPLPLVKRIQAIGIIARSKALMALYEDLEEVAQVNVPTFIEGEPGSGKDKVAQALHYLAKPKGHFVALNCSSIPEGIFESELFGSVKGAFSNATDKMGKLEQADNGTLFLDEIGDMDMALQPKLLRFLEDKKITRLGDTKEKILNVRIVTATNQDLKTMIQKKMFRDDLYQRLACIKLVVPPLRVRKKDILPLATFFLAAFAREHDLQVKKISKEASQILLNYQWPGNVRELRNVLLSGAIRNRGDTIEPEHLSGIIKEATAEEADHGDGVPSLKDVEKAHIQKALEHVDGNKQKAAKLLGISRDTLYKKLAKYKL